MSFFAQNATVSGQGGTFETAEAGMYTCRLKAVEVKQQPSFDNPEVLENRFQWIFETKDAADSAGNPFRFSKFTSVKFGNDKSGLTILLDTMMGRRLTTEEFQALDLDELKGKDWKVMVDEKQKANGYMANTVLSVKPAGARQQPAQRPNTLGGMVASNPTPAAPVRQPSRGEQIRQQAAAEDDMSDLEDPFADDEPQAAPMRRAA